MAQEGMSLLEAPETRVIQTDRLHLSTLQMSDLEAIMPMITDDDVMRWTTQGPVRNKQQGERWLSARALGPDVLNFAIRERSDTGIEPTVVGICGSFHWPKCGYLIRSDRAGRGYATEALRAFIPAYFEEVPSSSSERLGFDHLEGFVDVENIASQRVLAKCGFEICEELPGHLENLMGLRDVLLYRLPRPGKSLCELGLDAPSLEGLSDDAPEPPFQ